MNQLKKYKTYEKNLISKLYIKTKARLTARPCFKQIEN